MAFTKVNTPAAKAQAFCLVRDRSGKPRIDGDPRTLPSPIRAMMSSDEFETACAEFDASTEGQG